MDLLLPSIAVGSALGALAWVLLDVMLAPRVVDEQEGRFEEDRRIALRAASGTYRWFEPWVDELAESIGKRRQKWCEQFQQDLITSGETAPWRAAEYVAMRRVEALLAAVGGAALGSILGGTTMALMLGAAFFFGYEFMRTQLVRRNATCRRALIKRRFSSSIDLIVLMIEVGGSFQEALQVAAREAQGHALGDELRGVLRDLQMGSPRKESLQTFANRIDDDDVSEVVTAIIEGEELGTPLAKTLRTQANQLRQKRSQWAEKAAEESQVALVFPAMVITVACLVTIAAPFLLGAINAQAE